MQLEGGKEDPTGAELVAAVATRHSELHQVLAGLNQAALQRESRLPGWNRLTIACHLRYGAEASHRMTTDTLAGRSTAFYPHGRDVQRPSTLKPVGDESPIDVATSLGRESRQLDRLWQNIDDDQWQLPVVEPRANTDLGAITLWALALLRLTEVEVHGYDLDLGLAPWSTTFVAAALPMRLRWLPTRRLSMRHIDQSVRGSWALISADGPSFLVRSDGDTVTVDQFDDQYGATTGADATIAASSHELLSFILGRESLENLEIRGDHELAANFLTAFPAP